MIWALFVAKLRAGWKWIGLAILAAVALIWLTDRRRKTKVTIAPLAEEIRAAQADARIARMRIDKTEAEAIRKDRRELAETLDENARQELVDREKLATTPAALRATYQAFAEELYP